MSVVGQECSAAESSRHAQVIVKKPADYGSDTIGTKNAIDIVGWDVNCESLDLPKTQSHGVNAQNDF
jgi:hypothetical protein